MVTAWLFLDNLKPAAKPVKPAPIIPTFIFYVTLTSFSILLKSLKKGSLKSNNFNKFTFLPTLSKRKLSVTILCFCTILLFLSVFGKFTIFHQIALIIIKELLTLPRTKKISAIPRDNNI